MGSTFNFTPNVGPDSQQLGQPLGGLSSSQYTYSSFIYPLDLGAPGAGKDHYMIFHINQSGQTQFQTAAVNGQQPTQQATINQNAANDVNGTSATGQSGNTASQPVFGNSVRNISRVATTIVLYMPNDIKAGYQADWSETELGIAKEIVDEFRKAPGTSSMKELFQSGSASALKNAGNGVNVFTDVNLRDAVSLGARMVINNHKEVIFNGIPFRQFDFQFRFTPESEAEALNVDNIIRAFKFYAAPEILQGEAGRYWIYPGEFDIQYYSNGKENLFLNKISTCALTNIQVNYTPIGHWAAFRPHSTLQGSPSVCTDISLTFTELELMTKKRVLEGY